MHSTPTSGPTSRQDRTQALRRRHGRARRQRRRAARRSSTSSASPTTRSWSTRPTTARTTNTWPDGGTTPVPQREEHQLGGRLPRAGDGPLAGQHQGRARSRTAWCAHQDWLPTLLAAAGDPDIKEKLLNGYKAGGKTFKVHLDGYNLLPYLDGQEDQSPRPRLLLLQRRRRAGRASPRELEVRVREQRAGTLPVWSEPFARRACPKLFNLRMDPYERADITSNNLLRSG